MINTPEKYNDIIEFITSRDHNKRGVAFLLLDDRKVTAKESFKNLTLNDERQLRTKFDSWVDRKVRPDCYHGWDKLAFKGRYTNCFVFEHQAHRFYGFLCHPKKLDRSYELCVLVNHTRKYKKHTDPKFLADVEQIRITLDIQRQIESYIEDLAKERKS